MFSWFLISVAAASCFYGCWLVWLLLYVFMVVQNQKNDIFLLKFSPQVKLFAILTRINTNLKCIKDWALLWIKQTDGPGLCFEYQYEAQLPAPREALIKAGCTKNFGRERKVKNACEKKSPLKTIALAVDE